MSAPEPFEPQSLVGRMLAVDTLSDPAEHKDELWCGKCVAVWPQGVVIEITLAVVPLRSAPDTAPRAVPSLIYFPWAGVRISWDKPAHDAPHTTVTTTVGADGDVVSTRSGPA